MKVERQVVIIGGGPAGMAAAIWCGDLGIDFILLEKGPLLGGQLNRVFSPITNYPGIRQTTSGELIRVLTEQIADSNAIRFSSPVEKLSLDPLSVKLSNGENVSANAVIIATGVRRRMLAVPGEKEFTGRGILDSGAKDPTVVAGRRVVIVGGGDAALENALILSPHARQVYVVHRREEFTARGEFLTSTRKTRNITFVTETVVESFAGDENLAEVTMRDLKTGETKAIAAEHALVRIGVEPNTEMFRDLLLSDGSGYLTVNRDCETSVPGIYAVGDAANPLSPTIATAAGMGATAAKSAFVWINRQTKL